VLAASLLLAAAGAASAQEGLRPNGRLGSGIDPAFAPGWLSSTHDRFGYAQYQWRDAIGFAPSRRLQWAYSFSERGSLGMSYIGPRYPDPLAAFGPERQYGLFGNYALSNNWSVNAQAVSPEPGGVLRLNDLRIGLRRQF
jgi:hypothetical protein